MFISDFYVSLSSLSLSSSKPVFSYTKTVLFSQLKTDFSKPNIVRSNHAHTFPFVDIYLLRWIFLGRDSPKGNQPRISDNSSPRHPRRPRGSWLGRDEVSPTKLKLLFNFCWASTQCSRIYSLSRPNKLPYEPPRPLDP